MKTMLQKCIIRPLFVLFVLCFTSLFSGKAQPVWNGTSDISWYNASLSSFNISTPEQLAGLSQLVNSGNSFAEKTVNLTADIWLNAEGDSTRNWTPIGGTPGGGGGNNGSSDVSNAANRYFEGVFNGNSHLIHNLYCDRVNSFQAGLFGAIRSTTSSTAKLEKIVLVKPKVKARGCASYLLAFVGSGENTSIENCMIINGRLIGNLGGEMYFGGILAYASTNIDIKNCGVTGYMYGSYIGGLVGSGNRAQVSNSYYAGEVHTITSNLYSGIIGSAASGYSITNCYTNVVKGSAGNARTGTARTIEQMLTPSFITDLGASIYKEDCDLNDGFPILKGLLCPVVITGNTEICLGDTAILTASGRDNFVWSHDNSTSATIKVTPTQATTYTVTASNTGYPATSIQNVTVTVKENTKITGTISPEGDGTITFNGVTGEYSLACGISEPIRVAVAASSNYYITRIEANGTVVASFDADEVKRTHSFDLNIQGNASWEVVAYLDNKYTISTSLFLENNSIETPFNLSTNFVAPWGNSGIVSLLGGHDTTFYIRETARYHVSYVEVNGVRVNDKSVVKFTDIDDNHTIKVVYYDQCGITAIPFVEGFNIFNSFPECWSRTGLSQAAISTSNAHKTPNAISLGSSVGNALLVFPMLDPAINLFELQLKYALKTDNPELLFEVGVMTDPADATTFQKVSQAFISSTNWEEQLCHFFNYGGTGRYIAFKVVNGYVAYIDDILLELVPDCISISHLQASQIEESSALISWNSIQEFGRMHTIEYTDNVLANNWTVKTTAETRWALTGLTPERTYYVRVFVDCGFSQSDTLTLQFKTTCPNSTVGTPKESTNSNMFPNPLHNNFSYVQQIYTAEEVGAFPHEITGFALQYISPNNHTREVTIYLAETDFNIISRTNFIPAQSLVKVYEGSITYNNSGSNYWFPIMFDAAFSYSGTKNLAIIVEDTTVVIASNEAKFRTHTTSAVRSVYYYRNDKRINIANPMEGTPLGVAVSTRNNIMFLPCTGLSDCISPNVLAASEIGTTTAKISWVDGGSSSSFELEYAEVGSVVWEHIELNATDITLTDLNPNTTYNVRVKTTCNNVWIETTFQTEMVMVVCDAIVSLPFEEDFDSYQSNQYPDCWHLLTTGYNNNPVITNVADSVSSIPNALDFKSTNQAYNVVALPEMNLPGTALSLLQVSFKALSKNLNNGLFLLGIMENPDNINTFETIDTIRFTKPTGSWEDFDISLASYTGYGSHIAFMWKKGNTNYIIDDLFIDILSTCPRPKALAIDSLQERKAYFSWADNGGLSTQWEAVCIPVGNSLTWDNASSFSDTIGFIDGLRFNTDYTLYLRAICGEVFSEPANINFRTSCGDMRESDLPYFETFDTYGVGTTASFPRCWYRQSNTAPYINTTNYSGQGALHFSTRSDTLVAMTEKFDLDISTLQIDFALRGSSNEREFIIGIMEVTVIIDTICDNDTCAPPIYVNTFIPIDTISVSHADQWESHTVYFDNYDDYKNDSIGRHIAFKTNPIAGNENYHFYLDNLEISQYGDCVPTKQAVVSNITTNQAFVTWEINGANVEWSIIYGPSGFDPDGDEGIQYSAISYQYHTLTGLTPNTIYDIYVKSYCNNGMGGSWSPKNTFQTMQVPAPVPYTHNFEDDEENSNWALFNGTGSNQWHIGAAANNTNGGTTGLYISNTNGISNDYEAENTYVFATRTIDITDPGLYFIEFDWRAAGYGAYHVLRAFLIPDTIELEGGNAYGMHSLNNIPPAEWIILDTATLKEATTWTTFSTEKSINRTGIYKLAFFWKNDRIGITQLPAAVDNITFAKIGCQPITDLTTTNPTQNSITLRWGNGGSTATSWEVRYNERGSEQMHYQVITQSPYTLTGLTSGTKYNIAIRAICSEEDNSRWSSSINFYTQQMAADIPYTHDFENENENGNWFLLNGTALNKWHIGTAENLTSGGAKSLYISDDEGKTNSYVNFTSYVYAMRTINFAKTGVYEIKFDRKVKGESQRDMLRTFLVPESIVIEENNPYGMLGNSMTTPTNWIELGNPHFAGDGLWTNIEVEDTITASGRYNLVFFWKNNAVTVAQPPATVDNISIVRIGSIAPCTPPTSLTTSNLRDTTARISWSTGGEEESWTLAYKTSSETEYGEPIVCNTTNYILTGLTPETNYDVRIKSNCEFNKESDEAVIHFTTLAEGAITYTITPTAGANGAISPSEQIVLQEGESQLFTFTPNTGYKVKEILVNENYVGDTTFYLIENVQEDMTIHVEFVLIQSIAQHTLNQYVTIYPNPAKEHLKVALTTSFEKFEVTNLLGQVIYTNNVNEQEFTLDVANYRSGIYFIRLYGKEGIATKKFVVKSE